MSDHINQATQETQETIILRYIRDYKKKLLDKAFVALLGLPAMIELFKKCYKVSKNRDPKTVFNWACTTLHQEIEKREQGIALLINRERISQKEYSQIIEMCQSIANNMLQESYEPPSDNDELALHLWIIYRLYDDGPIYWPPTIEDICLDFSFAKLLVGAHRKLGAKITLAERDNIRTQRTAETRRKKATRWESFVLAIYEHGTPIAPETRLSEAIRIIQKQFEESKRRSDETREKPPWGLIPKYKGKDMNTPSRDSIINLFKEEGIRDRDFEKRGPYWFKKM